MQFSELWGHVSKKYEKLQYFSQNYIYSVHIFDTEMCSFRDKIIIFFRVGKSIILEKVDSHNTFFK